MPKLRRAKMINDQSILTPAIDDAAEVAQKVPGVFGRMYYQDVKVQLP